MMSAGLPIRIAFAITLAGCTAEASSIRFAPQDTSSTPEGDADADADSGADTGTGPCPDDMSLVDGTFCVDRYEAALEEWTGEAWSPASPYETVDDRIVRAVPAHGLVPQGYISGDEAEESCENAGKRLCTSQEWLATCQGPDGLTYPYGDSHVDGACNDHYDGTHPVVDYFGTSEGIWDLSHMNDPGVNQQSGTVAAGGAFTSCASAAGAFDMHGNLHEWVADTDGTFRGGFYADASINGPGCLYTTTAHARTYHDYSTGFRCCSEPD